MWSVEHGPQGGDELNVIEPGANYGGLLQRMASTTTAHQSHEAWLPAGSLTFITVDSEWDVNWVEGPPTADMAP
jgi:hypothetical protein